MCPQLAAPFDATLNCYYQTDPEEPIDVYVVVSCEVQAAGAIVVGETSDQMDNAGFGFVRAWQTTATTGTTTASPATTATTKSSTESGQAGTSASTSTSAGTTVSGPAHMHFSLNASVKVTVTIGRRAGVSDATPQSYGFVFDNRSVGSHWLTSNQIVGEIPAKTPSVTSHRTFKVNQTAPAGPLGISFAYWDGDLTHHIVNGAIGFEAVQPTPPGQSWITFALLLFAVVLALAFTWYRLRPRNP